MSEPGSGTALQVMMRGGCSLCDHLVLALELLRPRYHFSYSKVDVDADPELAERYGLRVPVLVAGTEEICEGHCNPTVIEAFLKTQ
ncbi:MAG: glutaredoxin family protein [Gammaproteobacteria bacterium]|jgi:hypothetical protein